MTPSRIASWPPVGIRALGTSHGDREVTAAELAALHRTTEDVVRLSIGDSRVYMSPLPDGHQLALRAARECLARADLPAAELHAIFAHGCNSLRLQHELGAKRSIAVDLRRDCGEVPTMLRFARNLIAEGEGVRRVLVVCAEQLGPGWPGRVMGTLSQTGIRAVFTDGAAAALLEEAFPERTLLGVGQAMDGSHWDHLDRVCRLRDDAAAGRPPSVELTSDVGISKDQVPLIRTALERCLGSCGIRAEQIDHIILPEPPMLPPVFARWARLDATKLFIPTEVTHIGNPDAFIGLEALCRTPIARPGQLVLLASRGIGVIGFFVVRL